MTISTNNAGMTRRTVLALGTAAGLTPSAAARAAIQPPAGAQLFCAPLAEFRASLSVSPFTESVLHSTALTDGTFTAHTIPELQKLYMRHGATEVYARIATRKSAPQGPVGEHGFALGLERAKLARDLGLPFNPELGLWAEYGDGGNYQQPPDFRDYPEIQLPAPWTSLSLDEMLPLIRKYTAIIARQILATGARVEMWDIGNEVEPGIAGVTVRPFTGGERYEAPDRVDPAIGQMSTAQLLKMPQRDRIDWCVTHLWPNTGRILAAASEGIRSVAANARVSTHISPIGIDDTAWPLKFYEICKTAGFFPDQFGFSYYPGATKKIFSPPDGFVWLKETTMALKARYGRPSFIAEGGVASGPMPPPFDFNNPVENYLLDETGQHDFNRDFIAWGSQSGCLAGYRPWAPDLCIAPVWAPMSWFVQRDDTARAKPVMQAFEEGLPSLYVAFAPTPAGTDVFLRANQNVTGPLYVELLDEGAATLARGIVSSVSQGQAWARASLRARRPISAGTDTILAVRRANRTLMARRVQLV